MKRNVDLRQALPAKAKSGIATTRLPLGSIGNKPLLAERKPLLNQKLQPPKAKATKSTSLQKENACVQPPFQGAAILVKKEVKKEIKEEPKDPSADVSLPELESFSSCIIPKGVTDIDSEDSGNLFLCSEYVNDVYNYLRQLEKTWPIRENFLTKQKDITPRMRGILIDWLNQVHIRFHLLPETLYLTVANIDRFLQEHEVSRKHLQLVGITAMFIAAKYEEILIPTVDDFIFIADNAYSKTDLFKMEYLMLRKLQFSFSRPLPIHFLRRNAKAADCDVTVYTLAKYIAELSLQEYELAAVAPSLIAASALRLAMKIMDDAPWTQQMIFYSNYTEKEIGVILPVLTKLITNATESKLQAVSRKYASGKFFRVSTLPKLHSTIVERIKQENS